MKILQARLFEQKRAKKDTERQQAHEEKKEIAWGSQIRSYVLQPYQLIKDHRTGLEIGNVGEVLNGNLDPFIEAYLQDQASA